MEDCSGERDTSLFSSGSLISQHCTCISMLILLSKKCTINMISGNFLINTGLSFLLVSVWYLACLKTCQIQWRQEIITNLIYPENWQIPSFSCAILNGISHRLYSENKECLPMYSVHQNVQIDHWNIWIFKNWIENRKWAQSWPGSSEISCISTFSFSFRIFSPDQYLNFPIFN